MRGMANRRASGIPRRCTDTEFRALDSICSRCRCLRCEARDPGPATGVPAGQTPARYHHPAAGPLHCKKLLRNPRVGFAGLVNDHRHQESRVIRHVQQSPLGEIPLAPEIAFGPRIGVRRNHGQKQAQSWICFLICESQASPPRSSLRSNHTSTPAARRASQIRSAASASWEA